MPELPEVETIKRQLEPSVSGRTITKAVITDPLVVEPESAARFSKQLAGRVITGLSRRGKYLRFLLDNDDTLVLHLRMTGRLSHLPRAPGVDNHKHLRLAIQLDDRSCILFHDRRRFGKAFILTARDKDSYWQRFGPEPLGRSFSKSSMKKITAGRRGPIKSLIMDQSLVAGIGNIYADEALFSARIHPSRAAGTISDHEAEELVKSIKSTLREAIKLGGSSIDTYVNVQGEPGSYQDNFLIHRREEKPCPACGKLIMKIKVGGRGTYFCPSCQQP